MAGECKDEENQKITNKENPGFSILNKGPGPINVMCVADKSLLQRVGK